MEISGNWNENTNQSYRLIPQTLIRPQMELSTEKFDEHDVEEIKLILPQTYHRPGYTQLTCFTVCSDPRPKFCPKCTAEHPVTV